MERAVNILNAIFDSFDNVWFFILPDYTVQYFNQKAFDNGKILHGRELKAGDSILDYARDTRNKVDEKFLSNFNRAMTGEAVRVEDRIDYNSTTIWTCSRYTPVFEQGRALGVSLVVEDITSQKIIESERNKQQEEIEKLSNKREEFINIASHELKTPLTSLNASLQIISRLLESGAEQADVKKFIEKSASNVLKLQNLVSTLLDSNKITQGSLMLEMSWFRLMDLVESCSEHVQQEGKHQIQIKGDPELQVLADKDRIDQVLTNLINNAVRYAPSSDRIVIEFVNEGQNTRVSVQDFGPGIAAEKISDLFKRYYQGAATGNCTGLGLGLYIAERIIKQHHGQIGVQTEEGSGSTFWFTLPNAN